MLHQDQEGCCVRYNALYLQQALRWLLGSVRWTVTFRSDCTWSPLQLAATAILWAWSDEANSGECFRTARRIAHFLFQPQQDFAGSAQAFWKMLVRWTDTFCSAIQSVLRERMQTTLRKTWLVHGFVVFGVDGSRVDVPRTQSHEQAFGAARDAQGRKLKRDRRRGTSAHAKKSLTPQIWLTLLWHVGSGLPWAWRSGPTGSNEREHWREMLAETPENSLLTGDAAFVGYDYLKAVLDSGRHLLVRVGSNVRLLKQLGWHRESASTVYLWPDRAAAKELPPLVLRLIVVQTESNRSTW